MRFFSAAHRGLFESHGTAIDYTMFGKTQHFHLFFSFYMYNNNTNGHLLMTIMYIFTVPTQHLKVVNKLTVHHMSLNIKMKRPAAYVHIYSAYPASQSGEQTYCTSHVTEHKDEEPTQHLKVVNKLTVHHMSLNIKTKRPAAYVRISATVGYIIITMYIYHALMIP